jgi:hypothetical protein
MKTNERKKLVSVILTAILVSTAFAGISIPVNASPGTIYVPSLGNETIQQAIDNATAGDTIVVQPGVYNENIVVWKDLTILSNDTAVIDALGADVAVYITASGVIFDGFTVTNVTNGIGIVAEDASDVQIINNTVELDMDDGGIMVENVTNAIVDGNAVNVSAETWAGGIGVFESENAQVTNNEVNVKATLEVVGFLSISEKSVRGWSNSPHRKLGTEDVEASTEYLAETIGIYVNDSNNVKVGDNIVESIAICEGDDPANNTYSASADGIEFEGGDSSEVSGNHINSTGIATTHAYPVVGIDLQSCDLSEISGNHINSMGIATTYTYADGMYANGNEILVEGNTINSSNQAEACEPWGMDIWDSEKARILNNGITISMNATEYAQGEGIVIENSGYAKVNSNTVIIDADGTGDNVYAGAVGIDASNEYYELGSCYRIEIAENNIEIESDVELEGGTGVSSEAVTLPENVIKIRELHNISISSLAGSEADGYGIWVNNSDLAKVHDNVIDISATATPESDVYGGVDGYTWIEGIDVWGSAAPEVTNNDITLNGNVDVGAYGYETYGYETAESEQETYGYGDAESRGIWIGWCKPWIDGPFYHLPTVANNTIEINNVVANVTAVNTTYAISSELRQEIKENVSESLEQLYDIINQAVNETKGKTLSGSNLDDIGTVALGYTFSNGISAWGSHAIQIIDNEVSISGTITGIANTNYIIQSETWSGGSVEAEGEGIEVGRCHPVYIENEFGGAVIPARVDSNTVSVDGAAQLEAIATEETVEAAYVDSEVYPYTWGCGIETWRSPEIEITANEVAVSGTAKAIARATTEVEEDGAFIGSSGGSESYGIGAWGRCSDAKISGNTIDAESNVLMDLGAAGEESGAIGYGESWSVGIEADKCEISDNNITVSAGTDGAVMSTGGEVEAEWAVSVGETIGIGVGIYGDRLLIDGNNIGAYGSVNLTVQASEEQEEAMSAALGVGIGVGIVAPGSEIARNDVAGKGDAHVEAISEGEYPENASLGVELGIGILCERWWNNVQFNCIAGSDDFGLYGGFLGVPSAQDSGEASSYYDVDAEYNWWGDASGPSGWGPGTGDAIYGTWEYEPWLTRPHETVLGEDKAYFGFELLPWYWLDSASAGEHDSVPAEINRWYGLKEGWNTMSTPIALEDNKWSSINSIGDGLDYQIAYTFDASTQSWVQILDSSRLKPLDAIYIKMYSYDIVPLCISPEINSPPVKQLQKGWNLIGPAYSPVQEDSLGWHFMPVDKALVSIEKTSNGLTGYTIVVSPPVNEYTWTYTVNQDRRGPTMDTGRGYWVYMENEDELAGFSSTPLQIPFYG